MLKQNKKVNSLSITVGGGVNRLSFSNVKIIKIDQIRHIKRVE